MRSFSSSRDVEGDPTAPERDSGVCLIIFRRGVAATAIVLAALVAVGAAHAILVPNRKTLTDFFFLDQDLLVAALAVVLFGMLSIPWRWRPYTVAVPATWRTVLLVSAAVTAVAWAGSYWVYDDYALSMDEFMARFDARILADGHLAAAVSQEWRAYAKALQPLFMLDVPGHAFWVSNYLPVNAMFLGLGLRLGAWNMVTALWAGLAVAAVFGVARRLWPDKPQAALLAAALLAGSPQLLITAMTPYAMSAHLAFNLVWLWLLLIGGRLGHGLAACVAFLATGLHQIVFHPLFAAPFVIELWLARRWAPAVWHSLVYAVAVAFWALYQPGLVHLYGATAITVAAERHGALATLASLLERFDPAGVGYMAKNLVRLITWQNLIVVPLALAAVAPAVRAPGPPRAMVFGAALTLLSLFILMPYQGHGWGYRYLHGQLGSLCLLAAWTWTRMAEAGPADRAASRALVAFGLAATLLVLLPLRAFQAHGFTHPYAVAAKRIEKADADIVMVDDTGVWFGVDLVRNRPFLDNRPIVLHARSLTALQKQALCTRYKVAWFGPEDAERAGVRLEHQVSRRPEVRAGC